MEPDIAQLGAPHFNVKIILPKKSGFSVSSRPSILLRSLGVRCNGPGYIRRRRLRLFYAKRCETII